MPKYAGETQAKNAWNTKHYLNLHFTIRREEDGSSPDKERLLAFANEQGKSVSRLVIDAINAYAGKEILTPLDNQSKKKKGVATEST